MAISINQVQSHDISITSGKGNQVTGVFAGIGNVAGVNVGGSTVGTGGGGAGGTGPAIIIAGAGDDGSDVIAYDTMLNEVRPGDLITSDFMTRLLKRINVLEAAVLKLASGGDVVVPDLFGQQLEAVAEAFEDSDGKLEFGLVLDPLGTEIDPTESSDSTRVVIGQHPAPGAEVEEGTALNLLVSIIFRAQSSEFVGGSDSARASPSGAGAAAAAPAAGELQRVTDEAPRPAASKGASKSRKSAAK